MTHPAKPVPAPDRDSLPFWEGVSAGELRVQRCLGCGALRWPARAICNRCRSFETEWTKLSGAGSVTSWITTRRGFSPAFEADLPYSVVLVQLAEQDDIQMIGRLSPPEVEPCEGLPVEAVFETVAEGTTLVFWRPVSEGSGADLD